MEYGLRDKVAVVTGGSLGIGQAIVRGFLAEGAKVAAASRHPEMGLHDLAGRERLLPVAVDLGESAGPAHLIEEALRHFGRVDILVNNIGIAPAREGFLDVTDEDWTQVLNVNLMATVRASRAVLPHMVERGSGVIINIASESGRQPDNILIDYSVSKSAMLSLSKALADEFGPKGIRVNTVSPGPTRTHLWDKPGGFADSLAKQFGMEKEQAIEHFAKDVRKLPLQRLGRPEEVAAVVLFLASDLASFVTGSEYGVNGGSIRGL
jgi:NAD(P)-dependent dehydrogenase (short-subunit alcohol dehydrogenase family)